MATGGEEHVANSLVKDRTIALTDPAERPTYISIVTYQDKVIVVDETFDIKIFKGNNGQLLNILDIVPSFAICLMDAMTMCVLSCIGLMSIQYDMSFGPNLEGFELRCAFDKYYSVVRVNDNIVVVGGLNTWLCWCIVSRDDGNVDTNRKFYRICKMTNESRCSVTTKDTIIYISCRSNPFDTGVYCFDILKPSEVIDKYKHTERLQLPTSIVISEEGHIFVGNGGNDSCIHQITADCKLVTIFTLGVPRSLRAMFWDNGQLYVTHDRSCDITVFRYVNKGSHKASDVLVSNEGNQSGIGESAIQISQGNVDNGQSSVESEMPPSGKSPEDHEDEKQDSEVPKSDEEKQPVIEGTSTQIGQEIPIEQSVEENLKHAGMKMSTEERDLFIKFQNEIGTDIYFSKGPHNLSDVQETLKTTEIFIEQNHPNLMDKWLEYRSQGKLTHELIEAIYAKERNQELHEHKDYFLNTMEKLEMIVKARAFNENGVKEENYFFIPCMLQKEFPREDDDPETGAYLVTTSVLCWLIKGTSMPLEIFQKLLLACLSRWPVAKKKNTSESLIFQNCTVFDIDLVHRLFLHCDNHAVFARITGMGIDHVNAKMCTRVRKFITLNLTAQDPSIEYQLCVQTIKSQDIQESSMSQPIQMWLAEEVHDPAAPITREHINHSRLCVAIITICGKAMRTILKTYPPASHRTIEQAILGNKAKLIGLTVDKKGKWSKGVLDSYQSEKLFPDPARKDATSVEKLDISLQYSLIKNITNIKPLSTTWGVVPEDNPRDTSLGANVERIHIFRNSICHSVDGLISQEDFEDYWNKIESVIHDIDEKTGQKFSQDLTNQRKMVISVYEAC